MKKVIVFVMVIFLMNVVNSSTTNAQNIQKLKLFTEQELVKYFGEEKIAISEKYVFSLKGELSYKEAFIIKDGKGQLVEVYRLNSKSDFKNIINGATAEHCLADSQSNTIICAEGSCSCNSCCSGSSGSTQSPSMLRLAKNSVNGISVSARLYIH